MSIIHEALKKTNQGIAANETQKSKGPGSSEKSSVRPTVEVHRNRKTGGWGPLVVLVLCLLVAGPILAPRYFLKPSDSALSSQTTSPTQQFAVEEAPRPSLRPMQPSLTGPARKEKDGFALSGVVYSAKESYCLINGLVLKVGERVGNATVESIAADQVILDINGKKLTIPVEKN